MPHFSSLPLSIALILIAALANATPNEISLPADTSELRPSSLPGYELAQQKCGICHSADYISYQPPGLTLGQWTDEMTKMQHSYGAPISEDEIQLIGAYLAVEYGATQANDPTVLKLSAAAANKKANKQVDSQNIDVQALMAANACMACHAISTKLIGPSFHDVAAKYSGADNALTLLTSSIRDGGAGKWGAMAMPPMSGLSEAEAHSLAKFVMQQ